MTSKSEKEGRVREREREIAGLSVSRSAQEGNDSTSSIRSETSATENVVRNSCLLIARRS